MTKEEKLELLAEAFDLDASELVPEAELDGMDNWDSMTKLSLVSMADEKFNKSLKKDILATFKTVQDILDYLG